VEFALVAPLFLVMLFGVIEFALINASIGAYEFAAVEGARYGAIIGPTAGCGSCSADNATDVNILNQIIIPRTAGIVMAQIVSVEVFKASESGGCFDGTVSFPCATGDTIYTASSGSWSIGWPDSSRDDELIGADYLGVRIVYQYTYLTAFFATLSPQVTLSAVSVQRIEPQEFSMIPSSALAFRAPSAAIASGTASVSAVTPMLI
jgi:hypothetical protein